MYIDLIACLAPLATLTVAAFVAVMHFRQAKTAREKLRLDLYNKRFAIYESALNFYQQLEGYELSEKKAFSSVHRAFIKCMRESKFLFDRQSGIYEILEKMHMDSVRVTSFRDLAEEYSRMDEPAQRLKIAGFQKEMIDVLMSFPARIENLEAKIAKYLDFHKIVA